MSGYRRPWRQRVGDRAWQAYRRVWAPTCWLRGHEDEFEGSPWYTIMCLRCYREYRPDFFPFTVGWRDKQLDPGGGWHHEIAARTIDEAMDAWVEEEAKRPWAEWGVFYFGTDLPVRWKGAPNESEALLLRFPPHDRDQDEGQDRVRLVWCGRGQRQARTLRLVPTRALFGVPARLHRDPRL